MSVNAPSRVPIKVVGIGGSLSPRSTSLAALDRALAAAAAAGADVTRFATHELDAPLYASDRPVPAVVARMCDAVAVADALIWSSPLYHGSVSGSFKNAIDWLQVLFDGGVPYLDGKLVALIGTAAGGQALQAINTMEFMVRALRGLALPLVVPIAGADQVVDARGGLRDDSVAAKLDQLGQALVRGSRRLRLGAALEARLAL